MNFLKMPKQYLKEKMKIIKAQDCSPIKGISSEEKEWLKELVNRVDVDALTIQLSPQKHKEHDPVISFDQKGELRAGRYIGEVKYKDRILRIMPRFGDIALHRWLSKIWSVHLVSSEGSYDSSRKLWVWYLLAWLWQARLIASARHGLPFHRKVEAYKGLIAKGRLDVRATIQAFARGQQKLVSQTRNKYVDAQIASILLSAFEILDKDAPDRNWFNNKRTREIISALRGQQIDRLSIMDLKKGLPIRYTPITDIYRPIVDLSWTIIEGKPLSSIVENNNKVQGIFLDMAEIWELYLYQILRQGLSGFRVEYTGRTEKSEEHLLHHKADVRGGLRPDFLVRKSDELVAILDAKYKTTNSSRERPDGVLPQDLYQMNAYLSAFGDRNKLLTGALVYPDHLKGKLKEPKSWKTRKRDDCFWFLGLGFSGEQEIDQIEIFEQQFVQNMKMMLEP